MPLNVHVITALVEEPRSLIDLRKAAGSPPQTTMRGQMHRLIDLGIIERTQRNAFPGNLDFELGPAGHDLLPVLEVLRAWLAGAPDGPIEPGSLTAKSSVKALVEGWSATIVRALAARPLSLTELDRLIAGLSYPSLERRLAAMRLAGQIVACPGRNRGTPYSVTTWLRSAVGPLAAAARWERKHPTAESDSIGRIDVEAAFLLVLPMVTILPQHSGVCRLGVDMRSNGEHRLVGVLADVSEGRVAFCSSRLKGDATANVTGSPAAWLRAVLDRAPEQLEIIGDVELATELVDGLYGALFSALQRR
ncbi:MAG: winged helix-turn-helix transcriptional regulator [Solirubrobacterales bacterium]